MSAHGQEWHNGWRRGYDAAQAAAPTHRAATMGCTGTGLDDEADDDALCMDYDDHCRLFIEHEWTHDDGKPALGWLEVGPELNPCVTADDAVREET